MRDANSPTDPAAPSAPQRPLLRRLLTALVCLAVALPAAAFEVITLATSASGDSLRVVVAAPASPPPAGGWSSLYLLNGYDGSHLDWPRRTDIDSIANARAIVIVMPDGGNSWYIDSPLTAMESAITGSLVPAIDSLYPTARSPRCRAVAGLSMGGHGALRLAGRHPDIFGTVASMSGAVDLVTNPRIRSRYGLPKLLGPYEADPGKWRRASAMSQVEALSRAHTKVWLSWGESDFFAPDNRRLAQALRQAGADVTLRVTPGDHNWRFWRSSLSPMLDFICPRIGAASPEN